MIDEKACCTGTVGMHITYFVAVACKIMKRGFRLADNLKRLIPFHKEKVLGRVFTQKGHRIRAKGFHES